MGHDVIFVHVNDIKDLWKKGTYETEELDSDGKKVVTVKNEIISFNQLNYDVLCDFSAGNTYISYNFSGYEKEY